MPTHADYPQIAVVVGTRPKLSRSPQLCDGWVTAPVSCTRASTPTRNSSVSSLLPPAYPGRKPGRHLRSAPPRPGRPDDRTPGNGLSRQATRGGSGPGRRQHGIRTTFAIHGGRDRRSGSADPKWPVRHAAPSPGDSSAARPTVIDLPFDGRDLSPRKAPDGPDGTGRAEPFRHL